MESVSLESVQNSYGLLIADHISAMLAYWDNKLVCRFANATYLDWFGLTKEEMIGKITLMDLLGDHIFNKNRYHIAAALNGEKQTFEREITVPGGEKRYAIVNYFPDIQDGEVMGFYAHVADITSIKMLENELKRSNEVISQQNNRLLNFANIVSHNLNSHAFNLSSILEFMLDVQTEDDRDELMRYLRTVSKGFSSTVKNLNEIVNAQNQANLKYEWINLQDCIRDTASMLINQFKESNCRINSAATAGIKIWGNPAYMDSIILNFLTNAIKYRHPSRTPEIELSASVQDSQYVIKVKDNGRGIDLKKHGADLFGMYKTFHGNADAQGIGLFITKFQIESMGGYIEAESEVNEGTTFTVYLPLKASAVISIN